jgi:hypothetical protein
MAASGQTENNSQEEYVFRFASDQTLLAEVGTSHLCQSTKSLRSSPLRGGQEPPEAS